ncbi:MAG: hypothetical protein ACK4GL_02615 [Flavobacteriales bacterium]
MKKRKFLKILRLVLIVGLVGITIWYVKKLTGSSVIKELVVNIIVNTENQFISETDVQNLLVENNIRTIGMEKDEIDLIAIETLLKNQVAVENAVVFTTHDGKLVLKIVQRTPMIRLIDQTGYSFYLDHHGAQMPLIPDYPARLPVATGFIPTIKDAETINDKTRIIYENLLTLSIALHEDEIMSKLIEQVYVNQNGEMELITKIGPETILIGDATDLTGKFERLKLFYSQGVAKAGWNKYATINIKINNQIICTKN